MTIVGITRHMNLTAPTLRLVPDALRTELTRYTEAGSGLRGATCLARGADQVFAHVVLEPGGLVDVVLPAAD